jgi:hypothetical protein
VRDFGLPNLIQFPIVEALSLAGDCGVPHVVADPMSEIGRCFSELGAAVVREVAKLKMLKKNSVRCALCLTSNCSIDGLKSLSACMHPSWPDVCGHVHHVSRLYHPKSSSF